MRVVTLALCAILSLTGCAASDASEQLLSWQKEDSLFYVLKDYESCPAKQSAIYGEEWPEELRRIRADVHWRFADAAYSRDPDAKRHHQKVVDEYNTLFYTAEDFKLPVRFTATHICKTRPDGRIQVETITETVILGSPRGINRVKFHWKEPSDWIPSEVHWRYETKEKVRREQSRRTHLFYNEYNFPYLFFK